MFLNTESNICCYIVQIRKLARHSFICLIGASSSLFPSLYGCFIPVGRTVQMSWPAASSNGGKFTEAGSFIYFVFYFGRWSKEGWLVSGAKSCPVLQALPSTKHGNISHPAEFNLKIKSTSYLLLSTVTPPRGTRKLNNLSNYDCIFKFCNQGRAGMVTTL